jgi:nucleotide-binding universal stress UspA family protein
MAVIEDLPPGVRTAGPTGYPVDIKDLVTRELDERLRKLVSKTPGAGKLRIETKLASGTAFIEIIREVLGSNHDLVMTGAEEERGFRERLFGGTTMHLMRKCPCPVWVIRPRRRTKFARIMAAVGPTDEESEKENLNETIMTLATSLARMEESPLHVVHCWVEHYEKLLRRRVDATTAARMTQEARNTHKEWLDRLLEQHPPDGVERHVHLLKGEPGSRIPELARKRGVDLVIMGTLSRTGIKGFLIGNTAERVLGELHCSIMTVKPRGFVTPVTLDG